MSPDRASGPSARRFKPYPVYKDSGVEWLGEIPAAWSVRRLKHLVEFQGGGTPAKENLPFWSGDIPWVSPKDMKERIISDTVDKITAEAVTESATRLVDRGAVLLVVRSGILNHSIPVAIAGRQVTLNQDLKALIPRREINSEYLGYFIEGMQDPLLVEWRKEGATVESLEHDLIADTWIPIPPTEEQRVIATFLARETARIDALVAKKGRVITLLQEKRTALITQAVTKGLDPNVPMKDSGVEWLGQIPAHWAAVRLRFLLHKIEQGWSPLAEQREAGEDEWAVLKVGCVNEGRFDQGEHKALPPEITPPVELEIREGDILLSRANTRELLGSAAVVTKVRPRLLLCDKLYRLTVDSARIEPRYLVPLLAARSARHQLEVEAVGASNSMQNITQVTIRDLVVTVPQRAEQVKILDFIEQEAGRIDGLTTKIRDGIKRLKELRTALISAAVTGKIDVRDETV